MNPAIIGASMMLSRMSTSSYGGYSGEPEQPKKPKEKRSLIYRLSYLSFALLVPLLIYGVFKAGSYADSKINPDTTYSGVVKYKHITSGRVEYAILVVKFDDGFTKEINTTYNSYYSNEVGDRVSFVFSKFYTDFPTWYTAVSFLFIAFMVVLVLVGIVVFVICLSEVF